MELIYVQFRRGCEVDADAPVTLGDAVRMTPHDDALASQPLDIPPQGRRVDAVEAAALITRLRPGVRVSVLGAGGVFVARRNHRRGPLAWLLRAALPVLLFGGAALGITFFHADVNMKEAQRALAAMAGADGAAPLMLAVPYALGVLAGVGLFLLAGGRRRSPLALKLQAYREQLEQAGDADGRRP